MVELKTKATGQKPEDFLNFIEPEQKRRDSFALKELTAVDEGRIIALVKKAVIFRNRE